MTKFVAWDLEIAREIPEGTQDWKSVRPLGITCAAALDSDGKLTVWKPLLLLAPHDPTGERYAEEMDAKEVSEMAEALSEYHHRGYKVITWNGLAFDFDVLAEECRNDKWAQETARVAMGHIDMGFLMVAQMGYMIGLDTCAKGLGLHGKTEGMSGALAPVMWQQGHAEQEKVLEYVAQDARSTAEAYLALLDQKRVYWKTRRGTTSRYPWMPETKDGRMLTVSEALELPEPDTSWMTSPRPRSEFYAWTVPLLEAVKTEEDLFIKEEEIQF